MKPNVLVVDDDVPFAAMLKSWLARNGYVPSVCGTVGAAKQAIENDPFDLILSDLRLPDGDGIMLLEWLRQEGRGVPLIVSTSYAEVGSAVAAMKLGAEDYLQKPIVPSILKEKIEQALARDSKPAAAQRSAPPKFAPTVVEGRSPLARQMAEHIGKVAPTKMSVLILGESGTGKEYAARAIHDRSTRADGPFLAVDCGSLSRELAPSELFGHLKGSFTSAVDNKTGVFEQAAAGTVFLDEVGNLSYEVQVQLLRALQEQKIRRVGAAVDMPIDVRILAATNENLEQAIAEGRFREDLYHRLNEFSLAVPPLRERGEDLDLFAAEFLRQANQEMERDVRGFSPGAIARLRAHHWSGNLRELRNVVRRGVLFAAGDRIEQTDLPHLVEPKAAEAPLWPRDEKEQIEAALRTARGNKTRAAALLQIDRKTLYNKIHLYGITL